MPALPHPAPDEAESPKAKAALLASQYERLPVLLALNGSVALVTVAVLGQVLDPFRLALWLLGVIATLVARFVDSQAYRRAPQRRGGAPFWGRRLTCGAGLTGAAWGLLGLFYDSGSIVPTVFIPFVIAGMVSGSVIGLSGHMPAILAFAGAALIPFATRLALEGDLTHGAMAVLSILYLAGVGYLGRGLGASLRASIRLGAERSDLTSELRRRSAQLEATIDGIEQGVAVFESDGGLLIWNRRHADLRDDPPKLLRPGTPLQAFLQVDLERLGSDPGADQLAPWIQDPLAPSLGPIRFERQGRGDRALEVELRPMPGGGFISTALDVTERKRDEARILSLAQHDPLTGLANRLLFGERLRAAARRAETEGREMAVMIADLDAFKKINDVCGHAAGDEVLKAIAARLRDGLREGDTVARIGGDEFALILPDLHHGDLAATLGAAVADRLTPPIEVGGRELSVRVSIGAAVYPAAGSSPEEVVQHADLAMYEAKAAGVGLRVYGAPVAAEIERRMQLERDLGHALEAGALALAFQPQVELQSRRIVGVEALLRWTHPVLGPLAPEVIVEAAERSGRMVSLGLWALRQACLAAVGLPGPTMMAVNVAASQFLEPDFVAEVDRILRETGLPPTRLELEVTETSALPDSTAVLATFEALRARGIRIALDDFGAGHASLARLRALPVDVLKIDRSLVADLDTNVGRALVEATIMLAHRLGLAVLAEGVETETQWAELARLGCDLIQGHAAGRPLTLDALQALLRPERPDAPSEPARAADRRAPAAEPGRPD